MSDVPIVQLWYNFKMLNALDNNDKPFEYFFLPLS